MKTLFLLSALVIPLCSYGYPMTPDSQRTPGELCTDDNPHFEEYRYGEQIAYCGRNVSASLKKRIYEAYGIAVEERKDYTIDHLLPLSIGGDNEARNLWPEHKEVKALRPKLEMEVYIQLRDGEISQREAVRTVLQAKFNPRQGRRPARIASRWEAETPIYATP